MADGVDVKVEITNLAQIKAAFFRAPQLMKKNLDYAIKRSVFDIKKQSQRITPVDTGLLRSRHYTRFGYFQGEVGTNTEYDIFVHEGTKFMTARPYLRDAVEVRGGFVQAEFEHAVQKTLDEIAGAT